jgi:hypothetical protein
MYENRTQQKQEADRMLIVSGFDIGGGIDVTGSARRARANSRAGFGEPSREDSTHHRYLSGELEFRFALREVSRRERFRLLVSDDSADRSQWEFHLRASATDWQ